MSSKVWLLFAVWSVTGFLATATRVYFGWTNKSMSQAFESRFDEVWGTGWFLVLCWLIIG